MNERSSSPKNSCIVTHPTPNNITQGGIPVARERGSGGPPPVVGGGAGGIGGGSVGAVGVGGMVGGGG